MLAAGFTTVPGDEQEEAVAHDSAALEGTVSLACTTKLQWSPHPLYEAEILAEFSWADCASVKCMT